MNKVILAVAAVAAATSPASATVYDISFSTGPMEVGDGALGVALGDSVSGSIRFDDTLSRVVTSFHLVVPGGEFTEDNVTEAEAGNFAYGFLFYAAFYRQNAFTGQYDFGLFGGDSSGRGGFYISSFLDGVNNYVYCNDCLTYTAHVVPSAAPEAASWALMLTGFGQVGAVTRRRRQTAVSFG